MHLEKATNQCYYCTVSFCDHEEFGSQRGCRKHVKTKHGWYLYFDSKPDIGEIEEKHSSVWTRVKVDGRSTTQELPTFPKTLPLAVHFLNWLQSTAGGGKTKQHSEQVLSRVLKFLKAVNEDAESENINRMTVDYCLGSVECIQIFVSLM